VGEFAPSTGGGVRGARRGGIAGEDIPLLFKDFQQLDSGINKQHQGTGLGLSVSRRLVEAQGGEVGVRSIPGEGSVFFFVLKRIQDNQVQADTAAPSLS
jgi:signal transduction histidine kinase